MTTATLSRDAYIDRLLSELTDGALEAISPRVAARGSIDLELDLWHALNAAFRSEGGWRPWVEAHHLQRHEALLLAFVQGAFQVAVAHHADGPLLALVADIRRRFEATTRQLRYRGLMRGPGRLPARVGRAARPGDPQLN